MLTFKFKLSEAKGLGSLGPQGVVHIESHRLGKVNFETKVFMYCMPPVIFIIHHKAK